MPNYRVTADQLQKPLVISCASEDRAWELAEIKAGKRLTNGLVEELPTRQDLKDQLAALEADKRELLDALQEMTHGYIHEASMRHGVTREQVSTISPITRNAIDKLHKHGRLE